MKYMLLIYQNPANWSELSQSDRDQMIGEAQSLMTELTESGEWSGGAGLAPVDLTKTVRVRGDVPAVTDGPFLEAKEHLVGYCLIDCASEKRALEIAQRWPDARYWAVELRPMLGG